MNIKLLSKLISVKKNQINALKSDYLNLTSIVDQLQINVNSEQQRSKEFSDAYFGGSNKISHVDVLMNSRYFYRDLHDTNMQMLKHLNEAKQQREAAYSSLNSASVELKVLEKLKSNVAKSELIRSFNQEQIESDLLAILNFNRIQA